MFLSMKLIKILGIHAQKKVRFKLFKNKLNNSVPERSVSNFLTVQNSEQDQNVWGSKCKKIFCSMLKIQLLCHTDAC